MNPEPEANAGTALDLSFVIPAYNEEENLTELVEKIVANVPDEMSYEVLLVNDGSTDRTGDLIEELAATYPQVRGLHLFAHNGKSEALKAGFRDAEGALVFTMDADLQNDPADIPKFLDEMKAGEYDILTGWRQKRQDHAEKLFISAFSNWWMQHIVRVPLHDINCGFKCFRNAVVKSVPLYGEMHRQIPVLAYHLGFKRIGEIPIAHHPRRKGRSKYGVERYWRATFDMMTALFLTRFSRRPLHFFAGAALPFLVFGLIATIGGVALGRVSVLLVLGLTALVITTVLVCTGFASELLVYLHRNVDKPQTRRSSSEEP